MHGELKIISCNTALLSKVVSRNMDWSALKNGSCNKTLRLASRCFLRKGFGSTERGHWRLPQHANLSADYSIAGIKPTCKLNSPLKVNTTVTEPEGVKIGGDKV